MLWIALPLIALTTVAAGLVIRHQRLSDEARERFDAAWNEMSEQERDAFVRRVGDRIMGDANER